MRLAIYKNPTSQIKNMRHFAVTVILIICQSCSNDKTEPIDIYGYFPLEIGQYQIYEVKEEIYSSGQKEPVIRLYQEKDEIERISINPQGQETYICSRSSRNVSTDYWNKIKEFSITKSPDKILTTIDNQTFFSLIFPVDPNVSWNGNSYNNMDVANYRYMGVNESAKIGAISFDKTLTVLERKDTSIINRYVSVKQYGLNVGLILDDQVAYEYCQNEDCIGSETIESGFHKSRMIIEYGHR